MKKVMLLLMIGFLCPGKVMSQGDSVQIMKKLNQLDQVTKETKALIKKSEAIEKKKENLMDKLREYIRNLKNENRLKEKQIMAISYKNTEAIKAENINEPVQEIIFPDGIDSVRGSFIYRLLHREKYLLKPYKIINNEKVYLD